LFDLWRLLSSVVVYRLTSSVTLHGGPAGGFTRAGQAMTSCCLQSNYSSTVTLHDGPVVLRSLLKRHLVFVFVVVVVVVVIVEVVSDIAIFVLIWDIQLQLTNCYSIVAIVESAVV